MIEPGGQDEFYHLANDPGETRDLANFSRANALDPSALR